MKTITTGLMDFLQYKYLRNKWQLHSNLPGANQASGTVYDNNTIASATLYNRALRPSRKNSYIYETIVVRLVNVREITD